jgi:hypothetical protein
VIFQSLRELCSRKIFCHGCRRSTLRYALLLSLFDSALGTSEFRTLVLVLSRVEQRTDLVNPSLAFVALYPAFFMHLVVLLLGKLFLLHGDISQLEHLMVAQVAKALMTPMVLIIPSHVIVAVPANPLRRTVHSVTVKDRRFEKQLLTSAKKARFAILSFHVFFGLQLFDEVGVVMRELVLHLLCHLPNNGTIRVVKHRIVER